MDVLVWCSFLGARRQDELGFGDQPKRFRLHLQGINDRNSIRIEAIKGESRRGVNKAKKQRHNKHSGAGKELFS